MRRLGSNNRSCQTLASASASNILPSARTPACMPSSGAWLPSGPLVELPFKDRTLPAECYMLDLFGGPQAQVSITGQCLICNWQTLRLA